MIKTRTIKVQSIKNEEMIMAIAIIVITATVMLAINITIIKMIIKIFNHIKI